MKIKDIMPLFHSPHHIRIFTIFCLLGAILSVIRILITGSTAYAGFVWNLILALLPYFFAGFVVLRTGIIRCVSFVLWFLFFPNSIYIWTEFIHLGEFPDMLHFDIIYISVMAIAGLVCGFASLDIMHSFWDKHLNKKIAWLLVTFSVIFAIFGVYIGRFLRLNSWDMIDSPLLVLREIWTMTLSNGSSLMISESYRIAEAAKYSVGITSLSTFLLLYFSLFMIRYVSVYHIKRAD